MTNHSKSLEEVKKMVEESKQIIRKIQNAGTAKNTYPHINVLIERNFPLLAQTLLNLMEDNEKMMEGLKFSERVVCDCMCPWEESGSGFPLCSQHSPQCQKIGKTLSSLSQNGMR